MKEKSAVKLQYAIEKSTRLDLKVDLMAPYLILPFGGFYTKYDESIKYVYLPLENVCLYF